MDNNYKIEPVNKDNVSKLKRFNQAIYPVSYSEKFYNELIDNPLSRVYFLHSRIVAAVCCKIDVVDQEKVLYIQSLGVGPLNRESGLGSEMLKFVEEKAEKNCLTRIVLHVQVSNSTAISFYRHRGFSVHSTIDDYYRRTEPPAAHFMVKKV